MKRNLLALSMAAITGTAYAGTVTTEGPDLVIGSKGDLSVETADGNFSFDIDGRLMWDNDSYDGVYHSTGDSANKSELRRSRLAFKGTVYDAWHYKFQYSFNVDNGGKNQLEDAYIKYTGLDFADITLGKYNIPFGLEELTSSKYISTIERSTMFEFVQAGRNHQNIQLSKGGKNYSWALGLYEGEADEDGGELYNYGGRVTFAPVAEKNNVVHLGAAFFQSDFDKDAAAASTDFDQRMAVHTAEKTVLTADMADTEDHIQAGLEAAWMSGPFSVQAEYVLSTWEDETGTEVEYDGYYVQGTWTLTGESRGYKAKNGVFDKIKPKGENGAWELVAKFEQGEVSDDRDPLVVAGAQDNGFDTMTLGVNWYANKNVRVSLNYLTTELDEKDANGEDGGDAISTRVQLIW